MTVEIATGLARCTVCERKIQKGTRCWHQDVNSRAAPFFCAKCLGRMARLTASETIEDCYTVRDGMVHQIYAAGIDEGALVEAGNSAANAIALALGVPSDRIRADRIANPAHQFETPTEPWRLEVWFVERPCGSPARWDRD